MAGRICHDFANTGKCKFGNKCKFSHAGNGQPSSSRPGASSSSARGGMNNRSHAPRTGASAQSGSRHDSRSNAIDIPECPRHACRSYWDRQKCSRGGHCNFQHVYHKTPNVVVVVEKSAGLQPLFQEERPGTDQVNVSGDRPTTVSFDVPSGDDGLAVDPMEAVQSLKRYMFNDYRFQRTFHVYTMMRILSSASANAKGWTEEDAQLILAEIATTNGVARLRDVLTWSPVSLSTSGNSTTLSFQRGFFPIINYLASDPVVKSSMGHRSNMVYNVVVDNLDAFIRTTSQCIQQALDARSFQDPDAPDADAPEEGRVFATLITVIFEVLNRFKNVMASHPALQGFATQAHEWFQIWSRGLQAQPSLFHDPFAAAGPDTRDLALDRLGAKFERVIAIVDREQSKIRRELNPNLETRTGKAPMSNDAQVAAMLNSYVGPGQHRKEGPRHDNDFDDIGKIRIAPTSEELQCRISPFLPGNLYDAPHPLEAGSMDRLLDIQFRLLREELTAPLRTSIQLVLDDLEALGRAGNKKVREKIKLSKIIDSNGGRYRGEGMDSVMFGVYTKIQFTSMVASRRGMGSQITLSPPPAARLKTAKDRAAFWERGSGKRLMQGGLVALIWKVGDSTSIYLATIDTKATDLALSSKKNQDTITINLVFFDPEVELRILQILKRRELDSGSTRFLIEAPVMFEAIRPFLEGLRAEPETIPFKQYIVHHPRDELRKMKVEAPAYAKDPAFRFQLASLFDHTAGITDLQLSVNDANSVLQARRLLKAHSRLDPSQADAVVDSLTREVALIQGPPGTGKSYTGVELLRVLLANQAGPVLLIALTNHALDHLLSAVLEKKITSKIVRLGGRSADPNIAQFSLESLERLADTGRMSQSFKRDYAKMKGAEEELENFMQEFLKHRFVRSSDIVQHVAIDYAEQYESLQHSTPKWITAVRSVVAHETDARWEVASKRNGKAKREDNSHYAFWANGRDLDYINFEPSQTITAAKGKKNKANTNMYSVLSEPVPPVKAEKKQTSAPTPKSNAFHRSKAPELQMKDLQEKAEFFRRFGMNSVPTLPATSRTLEHLLAHPQIPMWSMSRKERKLLNDFWDSQVRTKLDEREKNKFTKLREAHAQAVSDWSEGNVEIRRQLLRNVDIIGATTTGASKLTALLKGIGPKVLLVEEAGQVLEAHILACLVPSVEHLICIGDPLQLRPTLNNYALSMDNSRGAAVYRFDMSLMERLSSELSMSQIDVQRRMRPEVSSLIRNTLYPKLQDHELVKTYPSVRGLTKDVFFLNHAHRENGDGDGDESSSKYNTYEVAMVKDLVLYLLRQGCYSNEGDIVVLCAYLGQLARLRAALEKEVAVVIDERDEEKLFAQEDDMNEAKVDANIKQTVERVQVSQRVRLRTIDNYQGEEGEVVILSLVRNSGEEQDAEIVRKRISIGFLQSRNRTNVALSRAKQGLYILGNADNLGSRSTMWRSVIDQLEAVEAVGDALPVACQQHPESVLQIREPGQLPQFAPDGGCLRPCESRLPCGHQCPYKCHADDPHHVAVLCYQGCTRLCVKGHPCPKACYEQCGLCKFPIRKVALPCGHIKASVPCHLMESLQDVFCDALVTKPLPHCEHTAQLACSQSPENHMCMTPCRRERPCCSKACPSACGQCQTLNTPDDDLYATTIPGLIVRKEHMSHTCKKTLFCGHGCSNECSVKHSCTEVCIRPCRQSCVHTACSEPCATPCSPCQQPCTWACKHLSCPVPCGSPCARLPCDIRCDTILTCGHQCPSVCGEDCSVQQCAQCASSDRLKDVVDVLLQRTLGEIQPDLGTLDELTMTLACGHTFTIETLDGLCHMTDFYYRDEGTEAWIGLKTPPTDFMSPPACPACRAHVTCARYGRIIKRANLDVLENNIGLRMIRSLDGVHTNLEVFKTNRDALRDELKTYASGIVDEFAAPTKATVKKRTQERTQVLSQTRTTPAPIGAVDPANNQLHGISKSDEKAWKTATGVLMEAYKLAFVISDTRASHVHAWDAAFGYLFNSTLDAITKHPERMVGPFSDPHQYAMNVALRHVGQTKPAADSKYRVKACSATVLVRFALCDFAQAIVETLGSRAPFPADQCRAWVDYVDFVLQTCVQDARSAMDLSRQTESHRQATEIAPLIMQAELKRFNLSVTSIRNEKRFIEQRQALADEARQHLEHTQAYLTSVSQVHRAARNGDDEENWLYDALIRPAGDVINEWDKVERSLRMDTFYQPVTKEDQIAIVKALKFGTVGHFYRCPNGHPYVITECGGAMEESKCPECGAAIGGGGHRLNESNTRDKELQAIALAQGARNEDYWAPRN